MRQHKPATAGEVAEAITGAQDNLALVFAAARHAHAKLGGEPLFTPAFIEAMSDSRFTALDLAALLGTLIDRLMPAYNFVRAVVEFEADPDVSTLAKADAARSAMLASPGIHRLDGGS